MGVPERQVCQHEGFGTDTPAWIILIIKVGKWFSQRKKSPWNKMHETPTFKVTNLKHQNAIQNNYLSYSVSVDNCQKGSIIVIVHDIEALFLFTEYKHLERMHWRVNIISIPRARSVDCSFWNALIATNNSFVIWPLNWPFVIMLMSIWLNCYYNLTIMWIVCFDKWKNTFFFFFSKTVRLLLNAFKRFGPLMRSWTFNQGGEKRKQSQEDTT